MRSQPLALQALLMVLPVTHALSIPSMSPMKTSQKLPQEEPFRVSWPSDAEEVDLASFSLHDLTENRNKQSYVSEKILSEAPIDTVVETTHQRSTDLRENASKNIQSSTTPQIVSRARRSLDKRELKQSIKIVIGVVVGVVVAVLGIGLYLYFSWKHSNGSDPISVLQRAFGKKKPRYPPVSEYAASRSQSTQVVAPDNPVDVPSTPPPVTKVSPRTFPHKLAHVQPAIDSPHASPDSVHSSLAVKSAAINSEPAQLSSTPIAGSPNSSYPWTAVPPLPSGTQITPLDMRQRPTGIFRTWNAVNPVARSRPQTPTYDSPTLPHSTLAVAQPKAPSLAAAVHCELPADDKTFPIRPELPTEANTPELDSIVSPLSANPRPPRF